MTRLGIVDYKTKVESHMHSGTYNIGDENNRRIGNEFKMVEVTRYFYDGLYSIQPYIAVRNRLVLGKVLRNMLLFP